MNTDLKRFHRCKSVPYRWLILVLCLSGFASAQFAVHPDQPVGQPLVGFGAEMNPYEYCTPNWGVVSEENVKDYERKVIDFAPQHVRIFCLNQWFDPAATDPVAGADRRIKTSLIRTVELAQRAGATVNLTLWYGPFSVRKDNSPAPVTLEKAGRGFANVLRELIVDHKLSAIQYVTLQNEVNDEGPNGKHFRLTLEEYEQLYRFLDEELRRLKIREKIKIVAGDLVMREQELWVAYMGQHMADFCDGWSMHAYWDFWDEGKIVRRLGGFRDCVMALPPAQQKPMYATEFGLRGRKADFKTNDPGNADDGRPIYETPLAANQLARFTIESINRGYVAAVAWTMDDALYDHPMWYGLMGMPKDGWPLKPAYHVMKLFTHATKPGWRAVKINGSQEGVLVAAMASGDDLSVFALNCGSEKRTITIAGIEKCTREMIWNSDGLGTTAEQKPAGESIELPGLGVVVRTTLPQK